MRTRIIVKPLKQIFALSRHMFLAGMLLAGTCAAHAQPSSTIDIPVPLTRPSVPDTTVVRSAAESAMDLVIPSARPGSTIPLTASSFARIENPAVMADALKRALDALYNGDAVYAIATRSELAKGSLDRQILSWAIATSGRTEVPLTEISKAATELPGWPGVATLQRNTEEAVLRENLPAQAVQEIFKSSSPKTTAGMIALARAYIAQNKQANAQKLLSAWWPSALLTVTEEAQIINEFGSVLTTRDHQQRLIRALYNERLGSAKQLAGPAQAQSLFAAYSALANKSPNVAKAIADVDTRWHSHPAYLFLQIRSLRRAERAIEAAELMLKAPQKASELTDPDAWWTERRQVSRELLDLGKVKLAYQLVSAHAAESPAMAAEAEFHAGWYALRGLKDAKLAAPHFERIASISSGPISASRAYYWMGRAAEAGASGNADTYYARSAQFGTTFYGQLSAAKLGKALPNLTYPKPSHADRVRFSGRPAVQAIHRLELIGYDNRANSLYTLLSQDLNSLGELAILTAMAEQKGNHYLSLRIGKRAAQRGLDVGALTHPIGAIPASASIDGAGKALAYAIARQESEFNPGAVSSAGAQGLLQLMPATAKGVASRNGMNFSSNALTTDAAYNATLGAHFLGEQLDRFDGSYVLTIAAYNAGPHRISQWTEKYGDPRGKSVEEVIDWVERIPYSETRNYVQRVIENYEVYKLRLTGASNIQQDLVNGRR